MMGHTTPSAAYVRITPTHAERAGASSSAQRTRRRLAVLAAGKAFEPLSSDIEPTGSDFLGERPLDSAPPPLDDDL